MAARHDREWIGADFIGDIAVGGGAIGADDHAIDAALAQNRGRHVVGDHSDGNLVFM